MTNLVLYAEANTWHRGCLGASNVRNYMNPSDVAREQLMRAFNEQVTDNWDKFFALPSDNDQMVKILGTWAADMQCRNPYVEIAHSAVRYVGMYSMLAGVVYVVAIPWSQPSYRTTTGVSLTVLC